MSLIFLRYTRGGGFCNLWFQLGCYQRHLKLISILNASGDVCLTLSVREVANFNTRVEAPIFVRRIFAKISLLNFIVFRTREQLNHWATSRHCWEYFYSCHSHLSISLREIFLMTSLLNFFTIKLRFQSGGRVSLLYMVHTCGNPGSKIFKWNEAFLSMLCSIYSYGSNRDKMKTTFVYPSRIVFGWGVFFLL
jgi:hypothetical protein